MREISFVRKNVVRLDKLDEMTSNEQAVLFREIIKEAYLFLTDRDIRDFSEKMYRSFKMYIEDLIYHVEQAKCSGEEKHSFLCMIFSIKLGAKMPIDSFMKNSSLKKFISINSLDDIFFTSKLTINYTEKKGFLIPVESREGSTSWYTWKDLIWKKSLRGYHVFSNKTLLFKTGRSKKLIRGYSTLWFGITSYDRRKATSFRPYKYVDPSFYGHKHLLQVVVTWEKGEKFSYLSKTHVSLELFDSLGAVRSVGQDIYDHIKAVPMHGFFRATSRCSIIKTPDDTSYYSKHHREIKRITIAVTKEEHDKIILLVEADKFNCKRAASLLKGNCVSYVCTIFKRIFNYEVVADISCHEILLREFLPNKMDPFLGMIFKKIRQLPPVLQKALYFIPPLSFIIILVGIVSYISSYYGHNNHREYSMVEYLFMPWRIRCDIPRFFFDVLNKYSDDQGVIDREKYKDGFFFK